MRTKALFYAPARGDHQALEGLVQRHQAWIYSIAIRILYHPQDAEDATQGDSHQSADPALVV